MELKLTEELPQAEQLATAQEFVKELNESDLLKDISGTAVFDGAKVDELQDDDGILTVPVMITGSIAAEATWIRRVVQDEDGGIADECTDIEITNDRLSQGGALFRNYDVRITRFNNQWEPCQTASFIIDDIEEEGLASYQEDFYNKIDDEEKIHAHTYSCQGTYNIDGTWDTTFYIKRKNNQ